MNPSPMNQSKICAYGVSSTLSYIMRQRRKVDPNKTYVTNNVGALLEYIINGVRYIIVTSEKDFDVVRCPDRTYGKVDRKTKTFLGAY